MRTDLTSLPVTEPPILCAACEANNCTEPATCVDPAGEGVCQFHATHCDCGHAFTVDGFCRVCDDCRCADVDRETGYSDCRLHAAPLRTGDVMGALKTALGMGK